MTFLHGVVLGIIQGLTEFLPISSSAHLVLVPFLFGWQFPIEQTFPFDVLVQLGTLVAVIAFFWKDLVAIIQGMLAGLARRQPFSTTEARLGWYLVLATIPAGLAGLLIKDLVEQAFNSPLAAAVFLLFTAVLLWAAERVGRRQRSLPDMKAADALWMGAFQALSLFPGVSRSGATIAGGVFRHLDRSSAARFSFLMSIPVMLAAGALSLLDLAEVPGLSQFLPVVLVGLVAAAVVGYLSIRWLLRFLTHRPLTWFAAYCLVFAMINIVVWYARG